MWIKIKNYILDILFPKLCLFCKKEGDYLCEDCKSVLDISNTHHRYSTKHIDDLYFALPYQHALVKELIHKLKYEPFCKDLAKNLSVLIIEHFQLLDNEIKLNDFILIPMPLSKKKLKQRGFNQTEEIGKGVASFFKIPLVFDCLIKTKETKPQVELSEEEREKNVLGVFYCRKPELIKSKNIVLLDDVYTTGSTMEEVGKVLKEAGVEKIIGLVVAKG